MYKFMIKWKFEWQIAANFESKLFAIPLRIITSFHLSTEITNHLI